MFSSVAFALEQITGSGLTECAINDASGQDRMGYFMGKPQDVAAWLERSLATIAGPVTVLAWNDDVRKGGKPGEKKVSMVHRWRMYGTHGEAKGTAPLVVTGPAPAAPVAAPVDVDAAVARAVAAERAKWDNERLAAEVAELRRMLTADDDDDEDDDEDDEDGQVAPFVDLVRELMGSGHKKLPEPNAPAMTGTGEKPAVPEGWTDQEAAIVLAIRNARAQHPKAVGDYVADLLKNYGPANG